MSKLTILVVDDNPIDLAIFRRYLKRAGEGRYQILEAATGSEALELLQQVTPDCVLLDLHLPDSNGIDLLARIKEQNDLRRFPVIMLTVDSKVASAVRALQHGAVDYLSKDTVTQQILVRAIDNARDKHLLLRHLETHHKELECKNSELEAANQALREEKERFETLVAISPGAICAFRLRPDGTGYFPYASPRVRELLGLQPEEMARDASALWNRMHPDDLSRIQASIAASAQTMTPWRDEYRVFHPEQGIVWVEGYSTPVLEPDGSILWQGTATDITARKTVKLALQKSEAQLAGIIASAMDAIISIDGAHKVVLFNAAAEKMFLCSQAEALGQSLDRFLPERFRHSHAQYIDDFGRTGITNRSMSSLATVYGRRTDGTEFPLEATISHIETPERPLYSVILRDITERKRAEEMAQRQTAVLIQTLKALKTLPELNIFLEQVLATLSSCMHNIPVSLWLYDAGAKMLSHYLSCDAPSSQPGDERATNPDSFSIPCRDNPIWEELIATRQPLLIDRFDQFERVPQPDYRAWLRANGVKSVLLVPLLVGEETIGCLSLRSSVPVQYQPAELELAQALAQQMALAVHMNGLAEQGRHAAILQERNRIAQEIHDTLAQGFTGILAQLEAASYAPEPAQIRMHVAEARDLARQSLQDARRSVRALRPQSLEGQQLPGALAYLARLSTSSAIETKLEILGIPFPLLSEVENQLYRICQEALTNASKYSEATLIKVELIYAENQLQLRIQDNGKGFDVQAGFDGNGFGLIGMFERAEQIGGQMKLNTHPGQGTSITVTVPIAAPEIPK